MYNVMPLKYEYNALEPYLDGRTIGIHYEKHYMNYLNKLNILLKKNNYQNEYTKEKLVNHIDIFPMEDRDDILYNLGGVINHELYFSNMNSKNNKPIKSIKEAIDKKFGSYEKFKEEFIKATANLVGSGYTFLVINNKQLEIINVSNQDTPYSYNFIPILTIDLWEHAYYLQYQSNRSLYITNFFEIIDFDYVNELYEKNI